ncbi:LysR substrate-binding domain-containing protein [Collimonas silvisoli]|uniref:LysR substrate-binding domain-containing protein n=1 Tax=Collimonas silvisoli TaxID=2825884 RepID=UPI001B8C58B1|nr:LysR substrate-binding domain-containing protein [Collimonas silvisoli]
MKYHQLRAFVSAAEHGSIRAAARALFLSQAAVTKALRELEDDVGAALVVRTARGVQLTEDGQRLLVRARLIVRQMQQAREELRQSQSIDSGSIAIGLTPAVALTVLPVALNTFRQRYRQVSLRLVEGIAPIVLPGVRNGTLDFAMTVQCGVSLGNDFVIERCFRAAHAVAARVGHPLLADPTPAALAALEWVLSSRLQEGHGGLIQQLFFGTGVAPPERILLCESYSAAAALVRNTDLLSLFPEPLLALPECRGITAVSIDTPALETEFSLVRRADIPLTPAAAYFAACLMRAGRERFPSLTLPPLGIADESDSMATLRAEATTAAPKGDDAFSTELAALLPDSARG